jgi:flagellar assembly protein FliH
MSSRARRVHDTRDVQPFPWSATRTPSEAPHPVPITARPPAVPGTAAPAADSEPPAVSPTALAAIEREAFAKGFAQGERAGLEAGQRRADAMLQRLEATIGELAQVRGTLVRQVERQAVELAIAVAGRIVHREISMDPELMSALVRVALDRLGGDEPTTVRLHPEQYAALVGRYGEKLGGEHVRLVAQDSVPRGGCIVESAIGFVDATIQSQLQELTRALLGDDVAAASPPALVDAT